MNLNLNCIVIDDQPQAVELMVDHIRKVPFLTMSFATTNPIEALLFLDTKKVDCIFLDIEMPQMTGLDFFETMRANLGNQMPKVILVTGYDKYAMSGYEYGVFDYILKPVTFKRFKVCIDRLVTAFKQFTPTEIRDSIFIDLDGKKVKVIFTKIAYIEGAGNYISIVTDEGKLTCYKSMNNIMALLPQDSFFRAHKSFIISLNKVSAVRGNEVFIIIKEGVKAIPIGLTYKEGLLKALKITD